MKDSIKNTIQKYINTEILFNRSDNVLTDEKPLLGDIIDSMGLQTFVPFLEAEFGISIPDLELIPENFYNINSVVDLVERLTNRKQ
jgi:acyl carrier protein